MEMLLSTAVQSPFVSVYELANGERSYDDPAREAYAKLIDELHDGEFEEALFEASTELRALHQGHRASRYSDAEADRLVTQHFSRFVTQAEAAVDAIGQKFATRDGSEIVEREVESFVSGYVPSTPVEPAFENLFGKLLKKVGRAVKSVGSAAWQGVKKVGFGVIFGKLKALIRPFLDRVLQRAIGKLPEAVQPAARTLAERLGFAQPKSPKPTAPADASNYGGQAAKAGTVADAPVADAGDAGSQTAGAPTPSPSVQEPAGEGPGAMAQEFDRQIAETMLAQDEVEVNLEVARLRNGQLQPARPVFTDLEEARDAFIGGLSGLRAGESAEPPIQNFLPALLPALKLGFRIAGRPRVVNFLAQLLAKLVANLVGPQQAPALSRAIVDAGLKLLNLEMSGQERAGLAGSAVAATVEETVNRVAALPDHVLDSQELLEGFALEAFEQAAAANLPAVLSEGVYRVRPELLEGGINAAWLPRPFRFPRYKRCSRTFKVAITPHMAEEIESFDGSPLSEYLQDQLGLPEGAEVEAEVELYEAMPGSTAADITGNEADGAELGARDEAAVAQLHPLTHEAAARLLGRAALGRALPSDSSRRNLFGGQRLYRLAIAGRRPLAILLSSGRSRVRRLAHMKVILDATQDRIRVCVFLSETKTQWLAMRLRTPGHAGSLAVGFHKFLARRLGPILHGYRPRRLRIVHAGVAPGQSLPTLLARLPSVVPQALVAKLGEWLLQAYTEFTKNQAQQFLAAADDPADGVTLKFTIEHPPGLKELAQALVGTGVPGTTVADILGKAGRPDVHVEASPGHKCD